MRHVSLSLLAAAAVLAGCAAQDDSTPAEAANADPGAGELQVASADPGVCAIVMAGDPTAPALDGDFDDPAAALARSETWLAENGARDDVMTTDSGLQYSVLAAGDAAGPTPTPGQWVCVHYRGTLIDGREFDSSCGRGEAAAFPSDRLIPGWVEALQMMRAGDVWELYIHPDLAYRDQRRGDVIGPNEALLFRVAMMGLLDGQPTAPGDCAGGR